MELNNSYCIILIYAFMAWSYQVYLFISSGLLNVWKWKQFSTAGLSCSIRWNTVVFNQDKTVLLWMKLRRSCLFVFLWSFLQCFSRFSLSSIYFCQWSPRRMLPIDSPPASFSEMQSFRANDVTLILHKIYFPRLKTRDFDLSHQLLVET